MNFFKKMLFLFAFLFPLYCFGAAQGSKVEPLTTPKIAYPGSVSQPPSEISNENFDALPSCDNVDLSYCPNINNEASRSGGATQAQMDTYCPRHCISTRKILGSGWGRSSKAAVCPTGYAMVAADKLDLEYIENPSLVVEAMPIYGMSTYGCYKRDSGYSCSSSGASVTVTTFGTCPYRVGQIIDNYYPGSSITYTTSDGQTKTASLDGAVLEITRARNVMIFQCSTTYSVMRCITLGSIKLTCNQIPTRLVCARITPEWKLLNE